MSKWSNSHRRSVVFKIYSDIYSVKRLQQTRNQKRMLHYQFHSFEELLLIDKVFIWVSDGSQLNLALRIHCSTGEHIPGKVRFQLYLKLLKPCCFFLGSEINQSLNKIHLRCCHFEVISSANSAQQYNSV